MSYVVRAVKLKDRNSVVIPIPSEAGIAEGDHVLVRILDDGDILVRRIVRDEEIIDRIREGVEARGFEGENVEDLIRSCREWFGRH